jgi:hypothetical protein
MIEFIKEYNPERINIKRLYEFIEKQINQNFDTRLPCRDENVVNLRMDYYKGAVFFFKRVYEKYQLHIISMSHSRAKEILNELERKMEKDL